MADQSETQIRASLLQNLILLLSLTLFSLVFSFYCLKSLCTHSLDYFLFYCCLNFVSIFSLKKKIFTLICFCFAKSTYFLVRQHAQAFLCFLLLLKLSALSLPCGFSFTFSVSFISSSFFDVLLLFIGPYSTKNETLKGYSCSVIVDSVCILISGDYLSISQHMNYAFP